jgi:hypothetical protein
VCTTKEFFIFEEIVAIASSEMARMVTVALGIVPNSLEFICVTLIVSAPKKAFTKCVAIFPFPIISTDIIIAKIFKIYRNLELLLVN